MSATLIGEKVEGRATIDDGFHRTYTRVFLVKTTSTQDGPLTVTLATGVPRVWDPYTTNTDTDLGALCKSVSAQPTDSPFLWEVTVEYDSVVREEGQQAENPLARPADIDWSFVPYVKAAQRDVFGLPILNSAGQPFDPPPEMDDRRIQLTIQRNEETFDPLQAFEFQDATNSDVFFGGGIAAWKVMSIKANGPHSENGVSFWRVTYEFEFRREGWFLRTLDQGFAELIDGSLTPITVKGVVPSEPVLLDGAGRKLERTQTTLGAGIDADDTQLLVDDVFFELAAGGLFPDTELIITIGDEDMRVTAYDENTGLVNVERGFRGTVATTHDNGAFVKQAPTFRNWTIYKPMPYAMLGLP